jgi:beta-lactamase regulating signal transducer with metallopeptidase domain
MMTGMPDTILLTLLRTTGFLIVTVLAVRLLLRVLRLRSSALHRLACIAILLQGWFFLPVTVAIPWYEAAEPVQVWASSETRESWSVERGAWKKELTPVEGSPSTVHALQTVHAPRSTLHALWGLVLVWLGGMAATLLILLVRYVRFVWQIPKPRPSRVVWQQEWQDLLAERGVRTRIPLVITENLGPMLCLLPRGHVVLVPEAFWRQSKPEERLAILRHELSHYERGDIWKQWVMYLLALPHWFNPGAWWALRTFKESAEWSCDEAAAQAPRGGVVFVRALCRLVDAHVPAAVAGYCAHAHPLLLRVRRLLRPEGRSDSRWRCLAFATTLVVLCLLHLVRIDLVAQERGATLRSPSAREAESPSEVFPDPHSPIHTPRSSEEPGRGWFAGRPPPLPGDLLIGILDTDGDGTISAEEMANAAEALSRLDRDGDGELSQKELWPWAGRGRFPSASSRQGPGRRPGWGRGRPYPPRMGRLERR